MNEQGLKALENLGAELGAAKAEVERLREALRPFAAFEAVRSKQGGCTPKRGTAWAVASAGEEAEITVEHLQAAVSALSRQAEPTDTFTAVDMATAAAQGFRDGQAAVEQAAAQDERKTFEVEIPDISAIYDGRSFIPYRSLEAGERLMTVAQHLRIEKQLRAALTRPAQTDPQPEQSETVLVPVSVIEEAAHMLEAHSPGSGSVESFTAQDLRAALSAQGAGDASA